MTAQYPIAGGFPNYGALIIDKDGRLTREGFYLFKLLWDRTGGNSGQFLSQQVVAGGVSFMDAGNGDPEETFIIPGPPGLTGAAGPTGPAVMLASDDPDEPMMVPPRTFPGGWFDEKGSGGTYGFAAGVDFTAGTSTTLTLSQPYGSQANLIVAFDAAFQGADQFSLSGKTLTFTSAIPTGTSKVFVKGFLLPQ
nr:hypothetical protein HUO10_003328 [Paraburkholderia busanensis]